MRRLLSASVISVLTAGASLAFAATKMSARVNNPQDSERHVKMKDLPAAVQKTVREQSKGAIIRGLSQETEDGKTNYEVELKVNGHNKDVLIAPNGDVVSIEEQVMLGQLPAAVRTAIEQNAGAGKIGMIESITEGGAIVAYEAHVKRAGKSMEIKVDSNGQLISKGKG